MHALLIQKHYVLLLRKGRDNHLILQINLLPRASASKSEDFLEVVGLQATFPSERLERELVVLFAEDS